MTDSPHVNAPWGLKSVCRRPSLPRCAWVIVVQGDKSGLAIGDNELEHSLFGRAPDVRMVAQHPYCLVDYAQHTTGKLGITFGVELEDSLKTALCAQRIDYARHFLGRGRRTFFLSARSAK